MQEDTVGFAVSYEEILEEEMRWEDGTNVNLR